MAISNAAVTRAKCDACPQVVYAEAPAKPRGYTGHIQEVDGQQRETNATWFACQPNHISKAAQNALKEAKAGLRQQVAAPAPAPAPEPASIPVGDWGQHTREDVERYADELSDQDEQAV